MDLAAELARYGPAAAGRPLTLVEAEAYCRRLAATHYENFTVASWLLPRRLRQHFANVYAYCRWADDLADEPRAAAADWTAASGQRLARPEEREAALVLLDWWEGELDALYAGQTRHPVFIALARTVREFSLPKQPLADLLVAFRRDQFQTRYETLGDLLTYCEKSANPVGRIVLVLGQSYDEERAALADAICTGLQLANFAQDVARDYQRGRIYLPRKLWQEYGWDEAHFAAGRADDAWRKLLAAFVEEAERRLRAGQPLVSRVQAEIALPVRLFVEGGLAVLAAIRRQRYDVWSRRPTVTGATKLWLAGRAVAGMFTPLGAGPGVSQK